MTDPWRRGTDPILRLLRAVTVVVFVGVLAYLLVDPDRNIDDLPTIALVVAALLVLEGYERLIKLPGIGRDKDDDDPAD